MNTQLPQRIVATPPCGRISGESSRTELDRAKIWRSHPPHCLSQGDTLMKKLFLAAIIATFAAGSAFAQDASCETKAMGKDGKPLAGAAKTSFMKKCMADSCATKAVGSDGKKLAGAAKSSFMKKCEAGG
jgi:hypothetical protein